MNSDDLNGSDLCARCGHERREHLWYLLDDGGVEHDMPDLACWHDDGCEEFQEAK